jgi:hypothetical protein
MKHMGNIFESVKKEILSWPHVTAEPHRFGGLEFKYDKREMGHIHGNTVVDFPFPLRLRGTGFFRQSVFTSCASRFRMGQLLDKK